MSKNPIIAPTNGTIEEFPTAIPNALEKAWKFCIQGQNDYIDKRTFMRACNNITFILHTEYFSTKSNGGFDARFVVKNGEENESVHEPSER